MILAHPLFLIALAALAIPVIIHLFNFRKYRKIYFTNVRFISEINQETHKRSQLKHLLILFTRLLAIACLVMVFAQPYLPSPLQQNKAGGAQAVSLYIDNSFSMEALNTGGRLLDEAKQKAVEIAGAYKPSDRFQILTADFEGRHQRFVSREEFLALLDEVKLTPAVRSLGEVMTRQEEMLSKAPEASRIACIISDFQRTTSGTGNFRSDSSVSWLLVPVVASKLNNLYIDSAWFGNPVLQPFQPAKLSVRIRNASPEMMEKIPLHLTVNGIQKTVSSFAVEPHSAATVILPFTNGAAGIQSVLLSITDYPVTWDDSFFLSYRIASALPVLSINGAAPSPYLNALFGSDSTFIFRNSPERQLDYSSFGSYTLILLNGVNELSTGMIQELNRFLMNGGAVFIFPPDHARLQDYNRFLSGVGAPLLSGPDTAKVTVSWINTESPVYREVFEKDAAGRITLPENADLPVVMRHYTLNRPAGSVAEDLIRMQNGSAFLTANRYGRGTIYLCAVPMDEKSSNFSRNTVFVPTLYNAALLSRPLLPLYYSLSSDNGIPVESDSSENREIYKIRKTGSGFEIIPETRSSGSGTIIFPHHQIRESGLYTILDGTRILQGVAFNYDRRESDPECYDAAGIRDLMTREKVRYFSVLKGKPEIIARQIGEISQGTPLWKYFVFGTLAFLLAEILLIRFLKD